MSVHRGTVTRVDAGGLARVEVPRLRIPETGPLEALETDPPLAAGDRVLVAEVEGRAGDLVILGRIG